MSKKLRMQFNDFKIPFDMTFYIEISLYIRYELFISFFMPRITFYAYELSLHGFNNISKMLVLLMMDKKVLVAY